MPVSDFALRRAMGSGLGAWSGAAIGGGIGGLDMLRGKGKDVLTGIVLT